MSDSPPLTITQTSTGAYSPPSTDHTPPLIITQTTTDHTYMDRTVDTTVDRTIDTTVDRTMDPDSNTTAPPKKECPECGKYLSNVPEHLKSVHWKVKNFSCSECPYVSSFSSDLVKHIKARHPDCPFDLFTLDIKPHVNESVIDASRSGESTYEKVVEQTKLEVSSEVKTAACPYCKKILTNVPEHIKAVHNKQKSYFCNLCDYKTMFKGDLAKHDESVHQKRKKSCPECGKQVANVAEHVRLVHKKEKKFKCKVCLYMCSKQSDMKKHSRNVHKIDLDLE